MTPAETLCGTTLGKTQGDCCEKDAVLCGKHAKALHMYVVDGKRDGAPVARPGKRIGRDARRGLLFAPGAAPLA
jgi:hypothetical protein